jgi:hypothetical protein
VIYWKKKKETKQNKTKLGAGAGALNLVLHPLALVGHEIMLFLNDDE